LEKLTLSTPTRGAAAFRAPRRSLSAKFPSGPSHHSRGSGQLIGPPTARPDEREINAPDCGRRREATDAFGRIQKAKAVRAEAVYQAADNPNDVTVTHEFVSVKDAQGFVASEELKLIFDSVICERIDRASGIALDLRRGTTKQTG
jgi:hypothetical protein